MFHSGRVSYQKVSQTIRIVSAQSKNLIWVAADALEEQPKLTQVHVGREAAPKAPCLVPGLHFRAVQEDLVPSQVTRRPLLFVSRGVTNVCAGGH